MRIPTDNGHAWQRYALFRPYHMNNALAHIVNLEFKNIKIATVIVQCLNLQPGNGVCDPGNTAAAFMQLRGHVMVGNSEVRINTPRLTARNTQAFERLRRSHLVD